MKLRLAYLSFICSILFFSCQNFKEGEKAHPEYFDKVINKALTQQNINFKLASKSLDSAYNAFPNSGKEDLFRRFKFYCEYSLIQKRDYIDAMKYADSAVNLFYDDKKDFKDALASAYNLKADVFLYQYNYDDAFKYLYMANDLIKDGKNYEQIASININLGNVLYNQNKLSEALIYYQKAYQFSAKITSKKPEEIFVPIYQSLNNVAVVYEKLNQLDNAIATQLKLLKFLESIGKKYPSEIKSINTTRAIIYGNYGSTLLKQKKYDEAELNLKKSLELSKNDNPIFNEDPMYNMIKLGHLYLDTDRSSLVPSIIQNVQSQQAKLNKYYNEVDTRLKELIWKYNEKIGDIKNAYYSYKAFDAVRDSTSLARNNLATKDFNKEFIKIAQANEIEVLKKKDELKSVYLIFAIGLTFLSGLSIFLLYRNSRITKQNIKNLTILNAKISSHNEMMEKTLEALEQSQEENTHMMQVVAHDMRTPIAGVIGLTSLMLEEDDLNEEQREILSMINTSGADTLNFINDLLQVQHNKTKLIKEPVEMHTLLKYCITLLESKAKEKQQHLKATTIPIEINISREKIWRVMSNLISNAIKFSPHGTTIAVAMEEKPLSILISVKDNGIGIPPEMADKLFNMDAEVQREGTDGEKSFGLGLAISKQIIEAHNGNIWFESLPGSGTTFFVELPITEN
ncbi:tetratricopeptide repeat-containing sensor histidine kinase [Pedobacter frigiditerrae]|uniref:tetratricopeptide repeat-containing sensor histidine kinase n=1 Tax=Pedobacter frigiditerrae TaxID=2530452 RepID=UPI00292F6F5B|nr:tetratricopeptide repeat-containing sensor histidine kinase [Pedobacter frigiditerrae]